MTIFAVMCAGRSSRIGIPEAVTATSCRFTNALSDSGVAAWPWKVALRLTVPAISSIAPTTMMTITMMVTTTAAASLEPAEMIESATSAATISAM